MTRTEFKEYNNKAVAGTISDDLNPAFIFSNVENELLIKIAKGEIDAKELAKRTLEGRNTNLKGLWERNVKID